MGINICFFVIVLLVSVALIWCAHGCKVALFVFIIIFYCYVVQIDILNYITEKVITNNWRKISLSTLKKYWKDIKMYGCVNSRKK